MDYTVLESADFDFTPYSSRGDSGLLLLGVHRPTGRQYIVKHAYPECACNEFMYYVVGTFLGDIIPETNLILVSRNDRRPYQTRYLVGSRYLPDAKKFVIGDLQKSTFIMQQWIISQAVAKMLSEEDGVEHLIVNQTELYRIDTAAAFGDNLYLVRTILAVQCGQAATNDTEHLMSMMLDSWHRQDTTLFCDDLHNLQKMTGIDCMRVYRKPFERALDLTDEYMEAASEVLCKMYPKHMAIYYELYIEELKEKAAKFLSITGLSN